MKNLTPAEFAAKWADNTAANVKSYEKGINAVQSSPMEAAAQAVDAYVNGVREAAQSGKFADNLRAVSLSDWKAQTVKVGARNLAQGVADSKNKMAQVAASLLPQIASVQAQVKALPANTPAERRERMNRNFDLMSEVRVQKR